MNRTQLEIALRAAGEIARDREFIVFGSQSILGVVAHPPRGCLVSQELDMYPRNHPQAMSLLIARLGRRSVFARKHGFFVDCVTADLAAMPEGWADRLVPFRTPRTGGVTGWCVELHDVAASKLAAGRKKDLAYVRALLRGNLVRRQVLENRLLTLPLPALRREDLKSELSELVAAALRRKKAKSKKR
jgi:hypothetical protein